MQEVAVNSSDLDILTIAVAAAASAAAANHQQLTKPPTDAALRSAAIFPICLCSQGYPKEIPGSIDNAVNIKRKRMKTRKKISYHLVSRQPIISIWKK